MMKIAECCHENGHLFIIDEAYSAFEEIDHTPFLNKLNNKHSIAVAVKPVFFFNSFFVCLHNQVFIGKCANQHYHG